MNVVNLIGNVTKDLELKTYTNDSGTGEYVQFTLAVNEFIPNKKETNANFIEIIAFNKKAKVLSQYLSKGSKIAIEGKLNVKSFVNNEGKTIYTTNVVVTDFTFLTNNKKVVNGTTELHSSEIPF